MSEAEVGGGCWILKSYVYCRLRFSMKANQMEESFLNLIVDY